jgi:hypothetical protein
MVCHSRLTSTIPRQDRKSAADFKKLAEKGFLVKLSPGVKGRRNIEMAERRF